ncbi:MAG: chemotaxis protein CheV [Desulfovibrio sp.]|nr:MAG: chemotaxis protein CheV [Desulfovibrio sp.]
MANTNILLEAGTNELEIVEFVLHQTRPDGTSYSGHFGINAAKVMEIIRRPKLTDFPEVKHPSVLGAFNLRSKVIPLIDLCRWFNKTMRYSEEDKVIITEFNNVTNSFLVSEIYRIHRLGWNEILPPSYNVLTLANENITGIVRMDDRILYVLDMEKIVAGLMPSLSLSDDGVKTVYAKDMDIQVLFVDDSNMVRKTVYAGLSKAGFNVEVANDGQLALDWLNERKQRAVDSGESILKHVNIVISDVEMPTMDGHSLTKNIKDDSVLKELPVVLFSSLISQALRHKGESVGADEQIAKPAIGDLVKITRRLLTERQSIVFDEDAA